MKLSELRQIIKEELEEIIGTEPMDVSGVPQMARIGAYFKLVDDWKEKIAAIPNMLSGTKQNLINRIEAVMQKKQAEGADDPTVMSRADYGNQQEFQKLYSQYGLLNFYSKPAPQVKPVSSGVRGRIPTDVNVKLDMVLGILNKFKAGEDLTDAEKRVVSRALSKTIA